MSYSAIWSGPARRYFDRLDRRTKERMLRRLQEILADPRGEHSKPLRASASRTTRVGGWRIIFAIDDDARKVQIQAIAPRGQVYRDL